MTKSRGVYLFMGVNGVGKSTVTELVGSSCPDALVLNGSRELRSLFGGVTRAELERLSPDEKLCRRANHFLDLFRRARISGQLVLMDTHLLVPIRNGHSTRYENTWVDAYSEFVTGAYMLTANPQDIRAQREADELASGRKRDLCLDHIAVDQALNLNEFTSLVDRGALPDNSRILENRPGLPTELGSRVLSEVLSLSQGQY